MTTVDPGRLVYTIEEAAEAVRMSVTTIRRAIHTTDPHSFPPPLKAKQASRRQLIPADELARWVASLPDV
jgi:hypothetical protein